LERFPAVLEPLLFYVLHRATATIRDEAEAPALKLFVLDEAWRFVKDATVKQYITEALKTWRKRNAAMILATQSTDDFVDNDLLRTILENCSTKFFLANPGIDTGRVRELFHLNETEAARIASLQPKCEALLKRPDVSKVIQLHVDPASRWFYANADAPATNGGLNLGDSATDASSSDKGVSE
jgi:type IV secretion system protein VirB4